MVIFFYKKQKKTFRYFYQINSYIYTMFSKSCQYGLQGVLYIAVQNDKGEKHVSLKDIAEEQDMPYHFLSKILQKLVKQDILKSTKGANGGFSINADMNTLMLLDIVKIIDGEYLFSRCVFGLKECSDCNPCPLHHKYKSIRNEIKSVLSTKSIATLIQDIKDGHSIINLSHPGNEDIEK